MGRILVRCSSLLSLALSVYLIEPVSVCLPACLSVTLSLFVSLSVLCVYVSMSPCLCIVLGCTLTSFFCVHCVIIIVLHCMVSYRIVFCGLDCIVLHCIALHCIVLYCTVLYWLVLYCAILYCVVLCCIVLPCIVLYCLVLYCLILHCVV